MQIIDFPLVAVILNKNKGHLHLTKNGILSSVKYLGNGYSWLFFHRLFKNANIKNSQCTPTRIASPKKMNWLRSQHLI
jgi:hypothetical protein